MVNFPCPSPHRWQALLQDDLSPAEQVELNGHLDACPDCQRTLEECAANRASWAGTARYLGQPGPTREQALRDVMDRLKQDSGRDGPEDAAVTLDFLDPPDRPGALGRFGPYEVMEEIGRGGMGVVFKALDPALHRVVAVKVLAPQLAVSATARKRFTREARAAAAVCHEHVVTIHAVEEHKGLPYLVMHYVAGRSLQQRLTATGPLPVPEVLRIGAQTAAGLAAAHAQGLIHRDVKPANILLENGVERVKLTDFSLARAIDDANVTQSGVITGTPQYMAPEQARGEPLDARADLFSLGSVLYTLCTGRPPFRGGHPLEMLRKVSEDTPKPIRAQNPEVPAWLEAIVMKLMAKDPADRFASAAEVSALLERCLAHVQQPATVALPPIPGAPRPPRRRRWAAVILPVLAGLFVVSEATGTTQVVQMAATVLRLKTPDGTLVVEIDDPQAKVTVDGTDLVVTGAGVQEFRLKTGNYTVHQTRDGRPEKTEVVSIKQGEKTPLRVTFEPDAAPVARAPAPARPPGFPTGGPAGLPPVVPRPPTPRPAEPPMTADQLADAVRRGLIIPPHRTFPTAAGEVSSAVFSPDGTQLVVGDWSGDVYAYDFASGRTRFTTAAVKSGGGRFLAVSPDGATLAAVGTDQKVHLLDLTTGRPKRSLAGKCAPYYAVTFTADGKTLAAGGCGPDGGGLLELWDLDSGNVRTIEFADAVMALAIPPGREGRLAVGTGGPQVRMVDLASAKVKFAVGRTGPVRALAFSPDARWLAVSGDDGTVQFFEWHWQPDAANFQGTALRTGHAGRVTTVRFSPDGTRVLTASRDGTARLWDTVWGPLTPDGRRVATFAPGTYKTGVGAALFSPDGKSVVTAGDDGALRVWSLPGPDVRPLPPAGAAAPASAPLSSIKTDHADAVSDLAFTPDGKVLVTAGWEGSVRIWDVGGRLRAKIAGAEGENRFLAISPDGKAVATAGRDSAVRLWDVSTGREIRGWTRLPEVQSVAFAPDGKTLAAACLAPEHGDRGSVLFWDLSTGQGRVTELPGGVLSVAFAPHAHHVAAGTADNAVQIIDALTSRVVASFRQPGPVYHLAFSPDGKLLAASLGEKGLVRLWDWQTSREGATLVAHTARVPSLAFSPDGKLLAAASFDGTATVMDLATGRVVARFAGAGQAPGRVWAVAFTPDGRTLATAGDDRVIRFWAMGEVSAPPPAPDARPGAKRFRIEFRDKPWREVLAWFGEQAGLPVVANHVPTGTFTFIAPKTSAGAPREYTVPEVIDILNESLMQQKFLLVRHELSFTIIPADERVDPAAVPCVMVDELKDRGKSELVSVVVNPKAASVADLAPDIKKMMGPFGEVIVLPSFRQLILQDTAGNLRRIIDTLGSLEAQDRTPPAPPAAATKPGEKRIRFEFRDKRWREVLDWFSEQSGLPFISQYQPTGTFTFAPPRSASGAPREYTIPEVLDILNESLAQQQKYVLIRREKSYTIVPSDEKIDSFLLPRIRPDELKDWGRTEVVSLVLPLKSLSANDLVPEVRKMMGPFGEATALANNQLLLQDAAGTLRRVVETIENAEQGQKVPPAPPTAP